jgi:hypothetical protein
LAAHKKQARDRSAVAKQNPFYLGADNLLYLGAVAKQNPFYLLLICPEGAKELAKKVR